MNTFKSNAIYIKHYRKVNTLSINNNLTDLENDILSNKNNISTNLSQINTNERNISFNLGKINNITKTIMLKNIYFNDFDAKKDDVIVRELLRFDNTSDRPRAAGIHKAFMKYYFKKDDIIEID